MAGITRSDFILQDGVPHFIETNSNPGLSSESIVPKQVRAAGMTLAEFFDALVKSLCLKIVSFFLEAEDFQNKTIQNEKASIPWII